MINQTTEPATPETITPEPQVADAQAGADTVPEGGLV